MNIKIILFFALTFFLFGAPSQSNTEINESKKEEFITVKTKDLISEKNNIDDELKNNIWITVYENYKNYQTLQNKKKYSR